MPRPKNQKLRRATRATHPQQWAQFVEYATADVEAMREIHKKLPTWNYSDRELELWHLDQRINDRGIPVDLAYCEAAVRTAERVRKTLAAEAHQITGGAVESTTQRDVLLAHLLSEHGVELPDMKGDTIERRLGDPELPWQAKALLNNRLEASRASTAKYDTILRGASSDGRIRGTLQFDGAARTRRWAGRLLQPQNFKRTPKYLAGDRAVDMAAGAIQHDGVDLLYAKPLEVLAAGVPWAIRARPGHKLVAPDLSNIEGRVLAWQASETWKLEAFRKYDENPDDKARDLYILGYARSFAERIADVVADYEAGGKKRQIGKVQELALGYQGAVGAFVSMAAVYGIDLSMLAAQIDKLDANMVRAGRIAYAQALEAGRDFGLDEAVWVVCWVFTQLWRKANPAIVGFWYALENAVREVICSPGKERAVGPLVVDRVRAWLRIRLPSGTYLTYPSPRVSDSGQISYMGNDQYTRRWRRIDTYGGKLAENTTQAIARDVLADAMRPAEAAGFPIVMHVHDELVAEVEEGKDGAELATILSTVPTWAKGLPLSAGWYESQRYRKD